MRSRVQYAQQALHSTALQYIHRGYDVFFPLTEDSPVDMVIHKSGNLYRIQVKSVCIRRNAIKIKLRSTNNWSNKKYTSKDIDFIVAHERKNNLCYAIPIGEIEGMTEVTLRTKPYKGVSCRLANNYLLS